MKRLNYADTKCLKRKIPFYNFNNLAIVGGTRYVIKTSAEYSCMRYRDIEFGNCTASDYCRLECAFLRFLAVFFDSVPEEECTIIKYEPKWVVRQKDSPELCLRLHENGIDRSVHGITVSKCDAIVKEFVISSFRYNSFIQILFPHTKIIISPTDHMDLFLEFPKEGPLISRVNLTLRQDEDNRLILVGDDETILWKDTKEDTGTVLLS